MASQEQFCLEVTGDFACFTRPEMKVERVSYDVITPSAARGIFEAILWKPAICWQIERIEVLNPIQWINVRRNEVGAVASRGKEQIFIEDERQQRAGLFLRDVAYRLYARFSLVSGSNQESDVSELGGDSSPKENSYPKFAEMFKRRARKGQCFNQPYLGTREFSAKFRLVESEGSNQEPRPITLSQELGWMLYDMDYSDPKKPRPMFFNATLTEGVLVLPEASSPEVRR